jgi:cytochrome c peroxidase
MRPNRGCLNRVVPGRKWLLVAGIVALATIASAAIISNLFPFPDPTGLISTYNANGPIDESDKNVFFQSLGTNGRSCGSCHLASDGFGLGVNSIQAKFAVTQGNDPLFAFIDGANCPNGTSHDPGSHSLLLNSGLIRVFLPVPANAQYQIQAERDPYGCAVVTDESTGVQTVSVYRRPLPTTNLRFSARLCLTAAKHINH